MMCHSSVYHLQTIYCIIHNRHNTVMLNIALWFTRLCLKIYFYFYSSKNRKQSKLWINIGCCRCCYDQLTSEAERKVEQSRELLDTIVKEKKGKQVMLHNLWYLICLCLKWITLLYCSIHIIKDCFIVGKFLNILTFGACNELNYIWLFAVFSSCVWDHHRIWEVRSNRHPNQQTQV